MHSLHDLASLYAFSNLLSVKWANANLGASSPEDYGGYYQWAGTEDVSDTSIILKWNNCPYHIGYDEYSGWTKYNTDSDYGNVDNKTTLEASDDAATVNLGHHSQYSEELTNEYGKGFSACSLRLCRQVFLAFPSQEIWQTRLPNLNWSHYVALLRVEIVT